jgi:hypothetical protein
MANIEQNIAISALAIRNQGEFLRLVNEQFQCSQCFFKEFAILPAASEFPKKTAGPVHKYNSPAQGLIGGSILSDFCIDLIAFDDEFEVGMKQSVKKQHLFDPVEAGFPIDKGVLRHIKGSARGIESKAFGSGFDYLNYNAQRFSDAGKECVKSLGEVLATARTLINCSYVGTGGFIKSVLLNGPTLANGASGHAMFHDKQSPKLNGLKGLRLMNHFSHSVNTFRISHSTEPLPSYPSSILIPTPHGII